MAEYYDYLTNRGVIVPDTSTVLTDVQNEFKDLLGEDLDVSPETPQGRLIELITRCRVFVLQTAAASSNVFNLNKANGFGLDDLASLFLLSRNPATYTTTRVVLSGVNGTIVPAGTRLQTTGGEIFVNTANYVIGSAETAVFRAEKLGVVPCPVGTLTTILDAVNGLETAINVSTSLGTDLESDNAFRLRIRNSLNVNSIAVLDSISANLEALEGVSGVYLYDNYTDQAVQLDEISIGAHSILAVVDGGDPQAIVQTLYNKKTIGAGYDISTSDAGITIVSDYSATDPIFGTTYPVKFARPKNVDIVIEITVDQKGYTGSDLTGDIKTSIVEWAKGNNPEVDGIKIGSVISPFEIGSAVSTDIPEIFIRQVRIKKSGGSYSTNVISLDAAEKGIVTAANITVVIN